MFTKAPPAVAAPPVTLLTKRAHVDLLRTASAVCRQYSVA